MPGNRRKHVPLRTCIACHQKRPKRELVRVVRSPEGSIEVDPKGKSAGRGAYLCPDSSCWSLALDGGRLQRALRCPVGPEDDRALRVFAESLVVGSGQDKT